MTELYKINNQAEAVVDKLGVQIRSTSVHLKHKFVFAPLVYNKDAFDRDFIEMEMTGPRETTQWSASPSPSSWTTTTPS